MGREEAAAVLRDLADKLARHNALDVLKDGIKLQVRVPAEVELEVEVEIETDESSIEIEISW
jgi:amphi-Trp domain-containing protein